MKLYFVYISGMYLACFRTASDAQLFVSRCRLAFSYVGNFCEVDFQVEEEYV